MSIDHGHPEGPNPQKTVDISINPTFTSETPTIEENRLQEYNLLKKQIEEGKYDGDGPKDVCNVSQEKNG